MMRATVLTVFLFFSLMLPQPAPSHTQAAVHNIELWRLIHHVSNLQLPLFQTMLYKYNYECRIRIILSVLSYAADLDSDSDRLYEPDNYFEYDLILVLFTLLPDLGRLAQLFK